MAPKHARSQKASSGSRKKAKTYCCATGEVLRGLNRWHCDGDEVSEENPQDNNLKHENWSQIYACYTQRAANVPHDSFSFSITTKPSYPDWNTLISHESFVFPNPQRRRKHDLVLRKHALVWVHFEDDSEATSENLAIVLDIRYPLVHILWAYTKDDARACKPAGKGKGRRPPVDVAAWPPPDKRGNSFVLSSHAEVVHWCNLADVSSAEDLAILACPQRVLHPGVKKMEFVKVNLDSSVCAVAGAIRASLGHADSQNDCLMDHRGGRCAMQRAVDMPGSTNERHTDVEGHVDDGSEDEAEADADSTAPAARTTTPPSPSLRANESETLPAAADSDNEDPDGLESPPSPRPEHRAEPSQHPNAVLPTIDAAPPATTSSTPSREMPARSILTTATNLTSRPRVRRIGRSNANLTSWAIDAAPALPHPLPTFTFSGHSQATAAITSTPPVRRRPPSAVLSLYKYSPSHSRSWSRRPTPAPSPRLPAAAPSRSVPITGVPQIDTGNGLPDHMFSPHAVTRSASYSSSTSFSSFSSSYADAAAAFSPITPIEMPLQHPGTEPPEEAEDEAYDSTPSTRMPPPTSTSRCKLKRRRETVPDPNTYEDAPDLEQREAAARPEAVVPNSRSAFIVPEVMMVQPLPGKVDDDERRKQIEGRLPVVSLQRVVPGGKRAVAESSVNAEVQPGRPPPSSIYEVPGPSAEWQRRPRGRRSDIYDVLG
ncbi:hypothetical protein DPSP01_011776 [Paraphaeosphaeria sporulosa]